MNDRWLGGTLTNWATVSNSIKRLRELDDMLAAGGPRASPRKNC
jgi:small subunit ribosomal protein S2